MPLTRASIAGSATGNETRSIASNDRFGSANQPQPSCVAVGVRSNQPLAPSSCAGTAATTAGTEGSNQPFAPPS